MLSATPRAASESGGHLGVTNVHGAQTDPMARRRRGIPVVLNEALGGNIGRSSPWGAHTCQSAVSPQYS